MSLHKVLMLSTQCLTNRVLIFNKHLIFLYGPNIC